MILTPVESSNIAAIGHDPETNTMHVEFRGAMGANRLYEYRGVTAEQHQALVNAPSVGKHFHSHFKSRGYVGARIA